MGKHRKFINAALRRSQAGGLSPHLMVEREVPASASAGESVGAAVDARPVDRAPLGKLSSPLRDDQDAAREGEELHRQEVAHVHVLLAVREVLKPEFSSKFHYLS